MSEVKRDRTGREDREWTRARERGVSFEGGPVGTQTVGVALPTPGRRPVLVGVAVEGVVVRAEGPGRRSGAGPGR